MSSGILISLAAEFTGKKAFDKADKNVSALDKGVKKLAKAFAAAFAVDKVIAFGKASADAFIKDQAEATKLANVLKNLGLEFANPVISTYIDQLSRLSGVADSELRPAMQALVQQTGNLAKSQELLGLAIEVSRGSGESLTTVTNDLAQAYVGNTKGLKKYYLGLSQAELKTMSFAEVQKRLNDQFKGSNAAYLKTYAGQMEVLKVAAGEAQETIGKGLMDSLALIAGDGSVQGLADSMQKLAENTSAAIYGISSLVSQLKAAGNAMPDWLKKLAGWSMKLAIPGLSAVQDLINYGEKKQNEKLQNPSVQMFMTDQANQRLNNQKTKAAKEQVKATKALTAEQKKQAALKKAGSIFDLEQIQLIAALKGNLSEEEQKRVRLQLALLTENTSEAQKLTYELAKAQGLGEQMARNLASLPDAKNPFASWSAYLDMIIEKARLAASAGVGNSGGVVAPPSTNVAPVPPQTGSDAWAKGQSWWREGGFGATSAPVVVQIDGKTIASALMDQSLSGNQAYVNRRTGGFD